MIFSMGTLRDMTAASAPSARIQVAAGSAPTSFRMVLTGTPTHSLVLSSPSSAWGLISTGMRSRLYAPPPFPEHSRK